MISKKSFHWSVYAVAAVICIRLIIDIIVCFIQKAPYEAVGIESSIDYTMKVILDLMAFVGFALLLIEKSIFNYIVLVIILLFKLFFGVRQGADISYAYLLGANFPAFVIELVPLTATLFIRKSGLSGWNVLSSKEPQESDSKKNRTGVISRCIQLTVLGLLILFASFISLKNYPDFVNTFSKKASVFFGLHNNDMARLSLQRAQESEDAGLRGKTDYYIEWCKKMNPNDKEVVDGLAQYFFRNEDFEQALQWYKKALHDDPNDPYLKTSYALCLSYSDLESAVPYAEDLIETDSSNEFAACILRDYYNQVGKDDYAFYWGLRAFNLRENRQSDKDLEVFGEVLSKKICSTNYQNADNTLILSMSVDEQPIYGLSNSEYLERINKIQEKGVLTLFMHNRTDIGIMEDAYYFVHLPGYPKGEIWRSDKVKRSLELFRYDHPDGTISSLTVIR